MIDFDWVSSKGDSSKIALSYFAIFIDAIMSLMGIYFCFCEAHLLILLKTKQNSFLICLFVATIGIFLSDLECLNLSQETYKEQRNMESRLLSTLKVKNRS